MMREKGHQRHLNKHLNVKWLFTAAAAYNVAEATKRTMAWYYNGDGIYWGDANIFQGLMINIGGSIKQFT